MNKLSYLFAVILFVACTKVPGPGGSSSIRGKVNGINHIQGQNELTLVSFPAGSEVEHGDYWTFNSANNTMQYYVYYKHPNWITNPDPQLEGRTGIQVLFDYNQSNVELAQNTYGSLQLSNISNMTFSLNNDILSIQNNLSGYTMDADNGTSNVLIDILNQGKPSSNQEISAMADYRVFLVCGDNAYFSQDTRTNANGEYSFDGFTKGKYRVYVISEDSLTNQPIEISQSVEVLANKTIYSLEDFQIVH